MTDGIKHFHIEGQYLDFDRNIVVTMTDFSQGVKFSTTSNEILCDLLFILMTFERETSRELIGFDP